MHSRDSEDQYCGAWRWDEEKSIATGNPANSPDVLKTLYAIKKKEGVEGM